MSNVQVATNPTEAPSAPAAFPHTSLIIGSRNRPALLAETVQSVLEGEHLPTEIVVIDQSDTPNAMLTSSTNGSTNGSTNVPECNIRYMWSHSVGVSRARNAGIALAKYDVLAMIDDDVLVSPTWFGALIGGLMNAGPDAIVTGQVRLAAEGDAGGFAPSTRLDEQRTVYAGRVNADVLFSGNAAFHRDVFDHVGGFDERLGPGTRFPAAEDNDLGFRLLEAGYRIVYLPEAVVYHRAWRSERDYPSLRWNYGRGQGAFFAKHAHLRDRYMLARLWRSIRRYSVRALRRTRAERSLAIGDALFALGLCVGAARWLITQRGRAI